MTLARTDEASAPQQLFSLLKQFDMTMLLTGAGEQQSARPMAIAQIDASGTIWFVSSMDAARTRQVEESPRVAMFCQSPSVFLSVVGVARISRDQTKIDELWKESLKVWFPAGRTAPDLALIAVTPTAGEFWDQSGTKGLKYLFEAAKAYVKGEKVGEEPGNHASTPINESPAAENRKSVG